MSEIELYRTKYLAVFDTETTGTDVENDRIVTAFLGVMDMQGNLIEKWSWLINPGIDIHPEASKVHGITNERAAAEGMDAKDAIWEIQQRLNILDRKAMTFVIYNAPFDLTLLDREVQRHYPGLKFTVPHFVVDPMVLDKVIDQYRAGLRTLTAIAPFYGVTVLENAHDAEADCIMAGQIAIAMLANREKPPYKPFADMSIVEIMRRQPGSKRKQAEGLRDFWFKKGSELKFDKKLDRRLTPEEGAELVERASTVRTEWPIYPRPEQENQA